MSFKLAELQIKASMPLENIKDSLDKAYKAEHKQEFYTTQRETYDVIYPFYMDMTYAEYVASGLDEVVVDEVTFNSTFRLDTRVEIDYTDVVGYLTYEEYRDEVLITTEGVDATYDVDGLELTAEVLEVSELVRPYIEPLQTDIDVLVASKLFGNYAELRANEYPHMTEYVDAVVKGDTVAQQEYIDACLAVKLKYPKV